MSKDIREMINKILNFNQKINESKSVKCKKCGWSWELSDGGKDPYLCHKCGNDNSIK
jgi:DNA-directed RNA polymerase subunit RPC12/RpoP